MIITSMVLSTYLIAQSNISMLQWKPVYHFSPLKNRANDPNG
ncbi:MAG: hypothetical protein ABI136_02355 [Ginsengibacter sp.]